MQEEITLEKAVELYPDYKFTCVWTWQHKDELGDCVEQFEREYSFINATAAELEPYLPQYECVAELPIDDDNIDTETKTISIYIEEYGSEWPLRPDEAEDYTAEYNRYMEMDYLPPEC